jgi:uncharacterized membrane protein
MWVFYSLSSGIFNALWTSQIKGKVQKEGALPFTASIRWGVVVLLAPIALLKWSPVSIQWWACTVFSGILESLGIWALARGAKKDYYSSYALSNLTPVFVFLLGYRFLNEKVDLTLGIGVALVVVGALWLYYRGHWSWWGFSASVIGAFSSLSSKWVIGQADPIQHACMSFLVGAVFCTVLSLGSHPGKRISRIRANIWAHRYLTLGSALATYCFYLALFLAPLSRMSPLIRINMVVAFLLSVFHLKERHDWRGRGLGALFILLGILLVIWER